MFDKSISLAEDYHAASKNGAGYKFIKKGHLVHYQDDIVALKSINYVNYSQTEKKITLKPPSSLDDILFADVLHGRISSRDFDSKPISLCKLSDLLYYGNGYKNPTHGTKFVPSSGGLNSVELFVIAFSVEQVPKGIYYYNAKTHQLESVHQGAFETWVEEHVFYQEEYSKASFVMVMASTVGKLNKKYGLRAYRLALLDIGHVSQNIYLLASALKLKACASAGFIDDELDQTLYLDGFNVTSFLTMMIG